MMTWARLGTRLWGGGRTDFLGMRAPRVNFRWECEQYSRGVYTGVRRPTQTQPPRGKVTPELSVKGQASWGRRWGRHSREQEQGDTAWRVQGTQWGAPGAGVQARMLNLEPGEAGVSSLPETESVGLLTSGVDPMSVLFTLPPNPYLGSSQAQGLGPSLTPEPTPKPDPSHHP